MPIIIRARDYGRWLDGAAGLDAMKDAMAPYPAQEMEAYRVSTRVNAPGVNDPSLIERAA